MSKDRAFYSLEHMGTASGTVQKNATGVCHPASPKQPKESEEATIHSVGKDLHRPDAHMTAELQGLLERLASNPVQVEDLAGGVLHDTFDNVIKVPLASSDQFALIDADDYELIKRYRWRANRKGYAWASTMHLGRQRELMLHRVLMMLASDSQLVVDHINGDRLDNRKANLRLCSLTQNLWNSRMRASNKSGVKGVCWHKQTGKWRASVKASGVQYAKDFARLEDAAIWVRVTREALHGEFARHE